MDSIYLIDLTAPALLSKQTTTTTTFNTLVNSEIIKTKTLYYIYKILEHLPSIFIWTELWKLPLQNIRLLSKTKIWTQMLKIMNNSENLIKPNTKQPMCCFQGIANLLLSHKTHWLCLKLFHQWSFTLSTGTHKDTEKAKRQLKRSLEREKHNVWPLKGPLHSTREAFSTGFDFQQQTEDKKVEKVLGMLEALV